MAVFFARVYMLNRLYSHYTECFLFLILDTNSS